MKKILLLTILILTAQLSQALEDSTRIKYDLALNQLRSLLAANGRFKDAVFTVENAFLGDGLDKQKWDAIIRDITRWTAATARMSQPDYHYPDSVDFRSNFAVYSIIKDTVHMLSRDSVRFDILPFQYDFEDFAGRYNWANMFVSKAIITRKGNCHSLPYLYKILADELGAACWLSLAPNHIYIRNRCRKTGWYNTELTTGTFPTDAWMTASGYIPLQAIQSGTYMDTLSNQQSLALCVLDLAKGYEFQTHNYYDGFILQCCHLALLYHPANVQALLLLAETTKRIYERGHAGKEGTAGSYYQLMENFYLHLYRLGYREMPDQMYLDWLKGVAAAAGKAATNK